MKDIKTLQTMLAHLMVILDKGQKKKMAIMMVIILVGSLFELMGVSSMLPFIEALLTPEDLMAKPYIRFAMNMFGITAPHSVLMMVGIGIIAIFVIKNAYLTISLYLQTAYSNNIRRNLSVLMLRSFMDRPYAFFVENGSGVILRGVREDIEGVHQVVQNLFRIASEGFTVIAIAICLFILDPSLASGVLVVGLACMLTIVLGVKRILTRLSLVNRESSARLGKSIVQINDGIKDIMVYDKRDVFVSEYDDAYRSYNIANTKNAFIAAIPERIIEAFCISGIIIIVLARLNMGVDPGEFVPKMAVFAMAAFRILPSISRLTGYLSVLIYSRPMLEATYENIESARQFKRESESVVSYNDTALKGFEKEIDIRSIDWKYPGGKENVLSGLELTIKKGEAIGIIGESGSGKSTLADLLLRLYKPQAGGIYMDGVDISTIPNSWSRAISYVPQMVFLMDDTIRANIAFGEENVRDEDIWAALHKASLDDFVQKLPNGLDTIVGERGVKFSGGQRQRLAIARALFTNPEIMILDEATSALDNETEEAVMEAIDSLAGAVTLIIIAHRVTTLRNCDKIYEIVGGKAMERRKEQVLGPL